MNFIDKLRRIFQRSSDVIDPCVEQGKHMSVLELLQFALEAHAVPSAIDGGCVRLTGGADLTLEPRVVDGPPNAHSKLVQLDVVAHSPRIAPRCIVESMAGVGADRPAAERDAFGKFLLGSFHVLLTALADHSCESNPAEWLNWQSDRAAWRICDGPLLVHGPGSKSTSYPEFIQELEALFVRSVPPGTHWVRVFLGSFDRKIAGLDVLLDNEPWPEGAALLSRWDWAFPEEYRSLRHFFVAVPDAR
jgi:hypothetical protein